MENIIIKIIDIAVDFMTDSLQGKVHSFSARSKLNAFLNNPHPILWTSISGGASVGKKRLVYQLFEQPDQNDEWDHTSILSGTSELNNILRAIRKNTVICIEYAAENMQEIELFLNHAETVLHYRARIHLRLILIDRDEIEMDDDESPILQFNMTA